MSTDEGLTFWDRNGDRTELVNRATGQRIKVPTKLLQALPQDAMPSRPRGDAKERTFNLLIRDGISGADKIQESTLIGKPGEDTNREFDQVAEIPESFRKVFGAILDDHYVIEARGGVRFLFPFQSLLPGTYEFYGRYKMFNGKILAFLCQPSEYSSGFNAPLIDRFYDLFNDSAQATLLDETVLGLARAAVPGAPERRASAETLIGKHYSTTGEGPGALMPEVHRQFQRDLDSVLAITRLNHRDRVTYAINILYVHLALYFQRLAWLLEHEFRLAVSSLQDRTRDLDEVFDCFESNWATSPFASTIQFRVSGGQPRPVSRADACVTAYEEQHRRQLLLPANLSLLGAARQIGEAIAPTAQVRGKSARDWTFAHMAQACREDSQFADAFNECLSEMAESVVADRPLEERTDIARQVALGSPGMEVFREAIVKTNRSALRRHGRDIVHALVHRGGRGYISKRGVNLFYFEIGQDLLLLLAKVIVGQQEKMPFRVFLRHLRSYGFEPQNRKEEDALAEALRVLNLLEKHSDAGEAMYVHHFL